MTERRCRRRRSMRAARWSLRSAAATDVGRVRTNNEDGFVERPEAGIWAVADGMGGHSHGEVASRMVCDALADFPPRRHLRGGDRCRRQAGPGRQRPSAAGRPCMRRSPSGAAAPVVVLLVRGPRCGDPVGRRQPRVSLARGPARATDPRSQPGGTRRARTRSNRASITRAVGVEADADARLCIAMRSRPATDSCCAPTA